jgi:hypothetical protein
MAAVLTMAMPSVRVDEHREHVSVESAGQRLEQRLGGVPAIVRSVVAAFRHRGAK